MPRPDVAFQFNPAAVRAHDALHNHQAEAGAFFLGRVKRLENAVDLFLRNAAAGVGHAHPDAVRRLRRSATSACRRVVIACIAFLTRFTSTCCICVASIGVAVNWRASFVFTVQAAIFHFRPQQLQGLFHHVVQAKPVSIAAARAGSPAKIA